MGKIDAAVVHASTNPLVVKSHMEYWANEFLADIQEYGESALKQKSTEDQMAKALASQRLAVLCLNMAKHFHRDALELGSDEATTIARDELSRVKQASIEGNLGKLTELAELATN